MIKIIDLLNFKALSSTNVIYWQFAFLVIVSLVLVELIRRKMSIIPSFMLSPPEETDPEMPRGGALPPEM